jgi:hypothetical protein
MQNFSTNLNLLSAQKFSKSTRPEGLSLFLFGLSPKRNKKKILCVLCAPRPPCEQGEAGGSAVNKNNTDSQ